MKKLIIVCALLLSQSSWARVIDIHQWTTVNGTRVYFVPTQGLPVIDIKLAFYAGSARDANLSGLAALTADMLEQGSGDKNADDIASSFESVGANYSDSVTRDTSVFSLRSLSDPKKRQAAIDTFINIISKPSFPKADFERVKKQQLAALKQQQQSAKSVASKAFYQQIYQKNPYGQPVLGEADTVTAITHADVKAFHHHYYNAANAVLALVGDISDIEAKNLADVISASLPTGDAAPLIADTTPQKTTPLEAIDFPASQTVIQMGQLAIKRQSSDYFPLVVGNYVLGGGALVSRLAQVVREDKGLAYAVYSYFNPMLNRGPFIISLGTRNEQAQESLTLVRNTLQTFLSEGPTEDELQAAKDYLIGSFPLRLDSNKKIVGTLIALGIHRLPPDYLDTYREKIQAVSIQDIKAAFKRHIALDKMVTVTVGRSAKKNG